MNRRKCLYICCLFVLSFRLSAQLPDGTIAPDFTAQDIMGQTHHLYDLLNSGKIVVLEISATWCPPCWVYHTSHALQDLYAAHGPAGDDKLRVLWVEGDPNTNLNCLYAQAGCNGGSTGNFVEGTPYPILDNADIASAYQISYYPTIFIICPNKKTTEVKTLDAAGLWGEAMQCPVAFGTDNAGIFQYSPGTELRELCGVQGAPSFSLTNLGNSPLIAATIELDWNNNVIQTLEWTGYLPTYGEATIIFGDHGISNSGSLSTTISSVNYGIGDDDLANNVRVDNFINAVGFNSTQVLLKIRTDNYGEETYWEVRNDSGAVLLHGGNQIVGPNGGGEFPLGTPIGPGAYPNLALIRDTLELPSSGCYSIHFSDGYGDGMCCDFGTGYYKLYNLDNPGTPLITGGEFDKYSHRAFGAGLVTASAEPTEMFDIQLFPNPAQDFLNVSIEAPAGLEISWNVFNSLGQLQYSLPEEPSIYGGNDWQLPLSGWPRGIYFIQLKVGPETISKPFVLGE